MESPQLELLISSHIHLNAVISIFCTHKKLQQNLWKFNKCEQQAQGQTCFFCVFFFQFIARYCNAILALALVAHFFCAGSTNFSTLILVVYIAIMTWSSMRALSSPSVYNLFSISWKQLYITTNSRYLVLFTVSSGKSRSIEFNWLDRFLFNEYKRRLPNGLCWL